MRYLFILFFTLTMLFSASLPIIAVDAEQCYGQKGGYCITLPQTLDDAKKPLPLSAYQLAQSFRFPGLEFLNGVYFDTPIGTILTKIYIFGISLVGISAFAMFIYGGIMYIVAADNQSKVGQAKSAMSNAVFGVVLALTSWLILYTINPDFTFELVLPKLTLTVPKP